MKPVDTLFLGCLFVLSLFALTVSHFNPTLVSIDALRITAGADGILWQVQTTILSVGFAGLAIAAQLFAESPTTVGASRNRVLEYVGGGWFVGVGLVANLVIGIETAWLPSPLGATGVAVFWFVPTLALLVVSSLRLVALFGNPSRLDEVVRTSLIATLARRLDASSRARLESERRLNTLADLGVQFRTLTSSRHVLNVPVPRVGLIVKDIRPQQLRRALALLAPIVAPIGGKPSETAYAPAEVSLDVSPGTRTRYGQTAFRVGSDAPLPVDLQQDLTRAFQGCLEFESAEYVTPDEETDREITNLKDTIGVSLRSGAFGTAERALDLLSSVVRGVWTARPDLPVSGGLWTPRRPDWLFESIWDVEQDALISPRSANIFISQAMSRSLEASKANSVAYVEECLRSFEHLWHELLSTDERGFGSLFDRICTCLQNLAEFSYSHAPRASELQARVVWTLVSIVKLSMDAQRLDVAIRSARELAELFEYGEEKTAGRSNVRAGQLVLLAWLLLLEAKGDERASLGPDFRRILSISGTRIEVLEARVIAEASSSFARWNWWEARDGTTRHARTMEMSHFVDVAEFRSLASGYGALPKVVDQSTASRYERLVRVAEGDSGVDREDALALRELLSQRLSEWQQFEREKLRHEPISATRVARIGDSLRETIRNGTRLAEVISRRKRASQIASTQRPILGMNIRVPREYVVDQIFNNTYADSSELGRMIARGFVNAEDAKIVEVLRDLSPEPIHASEEQLLKLVRELGSQAEHYVLATPYGGLVEFEEWRSRELAEVLAKVSRVETSALEEEAFLFDTRASVRSVRRPETKKGLEPVQGTDIALGVFEIPGTDGEPQVRVESGEYFVVWPVSRPKVWRFVSTSQEFD